MKHGTIPEPSFVILGIIISKVTGVSYEQYVTKHIIEALGLERTFFMCLML
ncbi:hypothetical protein ACSE3M_19450 [Bacillus velezensis]